MYREGQRALESGLSRGASLLLGVTAALVGVAMIAMAPDSNSPTGFYGVGLFCVAIAVACVFTGRIRRGSGRLIGAAVFLVTLWYLAGAIWGGPFWSSSRSQPSVLNAATLLFFAGIPGLLYALLGRFRWRKPEESADAPRSERDFLVTFDDEQVTVAIPGDEARSIEWNSLLRVAIETNDSGPWGADVWWLLEGSQHRIAYPGGATGDPEMLRQYSARLAGFDNENVIEAMGCTSNARFVCWERREAP